MLKKLVALSVAAFVMTTGYSYGKVINEVTGLRGEVFSVEFYNVNENKWIPTSLHGSLQDGVEGDVTASSLPVGHYDKIRFQHSDIQYKGYVKVTDDGMYDGIYTTVPGDGNAKFQKTNDKDAADWRYNTKGYAPNEAAALENVNKEDVGSYQNGSHGGITIGAVSFDIMEVDDGTGNKVHKSSSKDINVVINKSHLWFGKAFIGTSNEDNTPFDASFSGNHKISSNGDTLTWSSDAGNEYIESSFTDLPEISLKENGTN